MLVRCKPETPTAVASKNSCELVAGKGEPDSVSQLIGCKVVKLYATLLLWLTAFSSCQVVSSSKHCTTLQLTVCVIKRHLSMQLSMAVVSKQHCLHKSYGLGCGLGQHLSLIVCEWAHDWW